MKLLCVDLSAIIKTYLLLGLKTIASRSSRGNQSWFNLMTQSSTSLSQFCRMQCWILCFQLLTASSVRILVNEIVKPSLKNLWHASLRTSWPIDKNHLLKTRYFYKEVITHTITHDYRQQIFLEKTHVWKSNTLTYYLFKCIFALLFHLWTLWPFQMDSIYWG